MRKWILPATVLAVTTLLLALLAASLWPTQNEDTISLAVTEVPGGALTQIADEKGLWKQEGLEVKQLKFSSGRLALDSLLGNETQFSYAAELPLERAIANNQRIVIIATVMESPTWHKAIARKDAGILTASDLKGKKVATLPGSSAEYFMARFFEKYGLEKKDLEIINLNPPDMVTAIAKGDIDAFFAWEPHIYNAEKQLGNNALVFSDANVYNTTFNIVAKEDFAKNNKGRIMQVLKVLLQAEQFLKNNQAESISIVSKNTGISQAALEETWDDYLFSVRLDQSLLTLMQEEAEWDRQNGTLKPGVALPDFRAFVYDDALKELSPKSVNLQ